MNFASSNSSIPFGCLKSINFPFFILFCSEGFTNWHNRKSSHLHCSICWCLFGDNWNGSLLSSWGRCSLGRGFYIQRLEFCFFNDKYWCYCWTYNDSSCWSLCSGNLFQIPITIECVNNTYTFFFMLCHCHCH